MILNQSGADAQLNYYATGDRLYLCTAEPANYTEAVSLAVGQKDNPVFGSVVNYDIGRQISISAITDGVGVATGTALFFAVVNTVSSELLIVQEIGVGILINIGGTITVDEIVFRIPNNPTGETFLDVDRPLFNDLVVPSITDQGYYSKPWNYDKEWNSTRKYPLVFICGPAGVATGDKDFVFYYVPDGIKTGSTGMYYQGDFLKEYPCFYYVAHPKSLYDNTTEANEDLARIKWLIDNERVDTSRIYLMGYSMGGQATFYLNDAFYTDGEYSVCAIARDDGGFKQDTLDYGANLWMHIGMADEQYRIDTAQGAYSDFKTNNPGGAERIESGIIYGYNTTTKIYRLNNKDIAKITEYDLMGHDLDPLRPIEVLQWLFNKRR